MSIGISVKNLCVSYGNEEVLKNISFDIADGELMAVIGPNGSGKTTLVRALLGLKKPNSGSITIGEYHPKEALRHYAGKISYLPQQQHINMMLPLTVYEVAAQGFKARKPWIEKLTIQEKEQIEQALIEVELIDKKDHIFTDLSGGQRQRVLLALAIANNPEILILDEPATALDFGSMERMYLLLSKLRNQGTNILVISHDLGAILSFGDKIGLLMNEFKYYGSPQNLPAEAMHQVFGAHLTITENNTNCSICGITMK